VFGTTEVVCGVLLAFIPGFILFVQNNLYLLILLIPKNECLIVYKKQMFHLIMKGGLIWLEAVEYVKMMLID